MDHQIHAYTDEINAVSQLIEDEKKTTTTYDVGNIPFISAFPF
jgi:hypothetical protein